LGVTPYTVGTSEVQIAWINENRTALAIFNHHATATIYIKFLKGVAAANGWPIRPYGSVSFSAALGDDTTQAVYCISDTATTPVLVMEGFPKA